MVLDPTNRRKGDIKLVKIDGTINPADFLTKPKSAKEMARLSGILGYLMPTRKLIQENEDAGILEVVKWINELNRERVKAKEKKNRDSDTRPCTCK